MSTTTAEQEWKEQHKEIAQPFSDEILDKLPDQKVLVQGVTVDFTLPSEGKLHIHGVRTIEGKQFKEDIGITIAPETYKTRFKNERRKFYRRLSEVSFILGKGEGHRNLYLIPLENVPEFLKTVEEVKEDFQEIQEEINAYLAKQTTDEEQEYLESVHEYVRQHSDVFQGVNFDYEVFLNFDVSLMPLRIDTATFKEIAADQVTQEMEKSLEQLKVEFARTRHKIVKRMVADLNLRFSGILKKLAGAAETKYAPQYGAMQKAISQTVRLAETANLDWLIRDLAEAVDATASVLSEKNFDQAALKRTTKLIAKALDLDPNDEPSDILWKAQTNLETMDERTRALIERM